MLYLYLYYSPNAFTRRTATTKIHNIKVVQRNTFSSGTHGTSLSHTNVGTSYISILLFIIITTLIHLAHHTASYEYFMFDLQNVPPNTFLISYSRNILTAVSQKGIYIRDHSEISIRLSFMVYDTG